ncbi:MAG: ATP-binding protein, partial [Deltaproteobacteria bacterium]|nr:ATP-binding protein [Deltaproteobacteria bacterium]
MLRGPRQVGKTTYLYDTIRKLLKNGAHAKDVIYLSLDFFTSRRELRNTLENFAQSTSDAGIVYIFLDEITSLDDWHLELKYMADQRLTEKAAIIVTGSNPAGMKERSDRIPGRGLEGNEYFIKPLSFRQFAIQSNEYLRRFIVTKNREFHASLEKLGEILPKKKIDLEMERVDLLGAVNAVAPFHSEIGYLFELYLTCGGYPAVINDYLKKRLDENRDEIDKRAGEVIIKDILDDLDRMERSKTIARDILRSVVSRYGSRYSFSNLSREIERNHPTTINYLECLEGSFLLFVFMAYDFARNMIKAKGDKKVYFFDPFVYHAVNGYLEGREVTELFKEARGNEEIIGKIV